MSLSVKPNKTLGYKSKTNEARDEDKEDSKELSKRMESLSMEKWLDITTKTLDKSNSECLEEEAKITLLYIENFINALESYARMTGRNKFEKKIIRKSRLSLKIEKSFLDRISLGMFVMNKISEVLRLERISSKSSINLRKVGSISEFEPTFQLLVAKFARVMERAGIKHNLEVSPLAKKALMEEEQPKSQPEDEPVYDIYKPSIVSDDSQIPEEVSENKEINNPIEFLIRIVSRNDLSLSFNELPTKSRIKGRGFYSSCELENFSVTSVGPDRINARNNSALKMIQHVVSEQTMGKSISPNKRTVLTDEELETAIRIVCLSEDYEVKLKKICDSHTAHCPVYKILVDQPTHTVQCQALGYSANGSHQDLLVARRIAARKLLQIIPIEGNSSKYSNLIEERKSVKKVIRRTSSPYERTVKSATKEF